MAKKDEGYLLDGSNQRVKSDSGEYVRTGSYDDEKVTENRMEAARKKLASEVQDMVKAKSDSDRVSKDAEESSKAPAPSVKMPTRPGQGAAKAKSGIVTKEELAKSGLSLRDYMNKQRGLTRRDGKAPERKTAPSAKGSTIQSMDTDVMRTASRTAAKEAGEKRKASPPGKASTTAKKPEPYNPPAAKFFKSLRARGEKDLAERGMAKGGSINGIAKRGLTKCKTV